MLENKVAKAFFTLLRAGLWNESIDYIECFPLSKEDWNTLFIVSIRHTVEGVIFDGIQMLSKDYLPPREIYLKWMVRIEKISQRNVWMNNIIGEQVRFFSTKNLNPILLKGQGLAKYYVDPYKRVCGDIDWYFQSKDDFYKANELLTQNGISIQATAGYSSCYLWKSCEIDHHQKLFDIYNPFSSRYLQYLRENEKENYIQISIQGIDVKLLSPVLQILQVNVHILKHLLSFGIGIRQLCDAAVLYKAYKNRISGENLQAIYTKLRIVKWIALLHEVLVKYIGFPKESFPFSYKVKQSADWMMEEIWRSGNFGFYDERYKIKDNSNSYKRWNTKKRLWNNFVKYVPYAPMEAISFPVIHFYSRLVKK